MHINMICIYINDMLRFLKSWGIPKSARVSILSPRPLDPEKSMPSWMQRLRPIRTNHPKMWLRMAGFRKFGIK